MSGDRSISDHTNYTTIRADGPILLITMASGGGGCCHNEKFQPVLAQQISTFSIVVRTVLLFCAATVIAVATNIIGKYAFVSLGMMAEDAANRSALLAGSVQTCNNINVCVECM